MRLLSVLSALALCATLALPSWAEDEATEAAEATNTVCPVSGEEVSSDTVVMVTVDGEEVAIATCGTEECAVAIKADPAKYAAAAKANVQADSDDEAQDDDEDDSSEDDSE